MKGLIPSYLLTRGIGANTTYHRGKNDFALINCTETATHNQTYRHTNRCDSVRISSTGHKYE